MLLRRYNAVQVTTDEFLGVQKQCLDLPQALVLGERDYELYTLQENENIFTLAHKLYGAPSFFWRIAEMNPEIWFPLDIVAGVQVRLPLD